MLPVPLNSSKMTSSIFEPVSTSAVARIVERAALLDVAGGSEELLRRVERTGVDTTGHDPTGRRLGEVVGPGEPGDAVEDDHDVPAELDEALGPLDRELRDRGVLVGGPVEGRGDHLALHRAAHVGDLFGTLVDEQDDEVDARGCSASIEWAICFRIVVLPAFGGDTIMPALALADRRDQVDDPCGRC